MKIETPKSIFKMKQFITKLYVLGLFITMSMTAFAQAKVSGTITDSDTNEPLIGATVVVQGTTNGTVTSLDGTFNLKVDNGKCNLVFSYIGYVDQEKSINVNGDENIGTISLKSDAVGLNEVQVLASVVTDRSTPVSISTLPAEVITEKLGSQEYPELLKTTPSIYTSKEGGGFGDATVYVRGFDSNNVGVLINGVPVNDMESGRVYWSNWAGLSDVTRTMQVQRGLGASKLGLSSVGGTINILTKSTDAKKGGVIKSYVGNNGYRKQLLSFSTGMSENGWALSFLGSHTYGDGYVMGTNFDAWSYFVNIAKRFNDEHTLAFTIVGAPQWHNQRGTKLTIETYKHNKYGKRYNSNYGIRQGQPYGGGYGYNYYHKPQAQLNHYWTINDNTNLTTSVYASMGTGGGRRVAGSLSRTGDGLLDFDSAIEANQESVVDGSQTIVGNSVNNHQWYGLLSTWIKDVNTFKYTLGLDARYYNGEHYREIDDLLGGEFYLDDNFITRDANEKLVEGDKYSYHNDGNVLYTGLFGQVEYIQSKFTSFLSAALSRKSYRRVDYYQYMPGNQKSEWKDFLPWNVKAGVSYKLTENHSIYANGGYIKRTPYFSNVFLNYTNEINDDVKYEQIITSELGYIFTSTKFNAKVSLYRTNWRDKGLMINYSLEVADPENPTETIFEDRTANIAGLNQLHQGVEFEGTYKPNSRMTLKGMLSFGDYIYQDDVNFALYDGQDLVAQKNAYIKDVHVGNSAQTTGSVSLDYKIMEGLKLGVDYVYYGKHYADFDPENRSALTDSGVDAWELPEVGLVDLNFNYKFTIGGIKATLYGNVNNVFNTEYISKAEDGANHDDLTSEVYFGFGTTWSGGLKINF